MLNSRQKLAQQLLNKPKEAENINDSHTKQKLTVPPKLKRPLVNKDSENKADENAEIIKNENKQDKDVNEILKDKSKIFGEGVINNNANAIENDSKLSNPAKASDDFYINNKNYSHDTAKNKHDNNYNNINNEHNKKSSNLGIIGGIIGNSNVIIENATSQLFNFFGNLANNINANNETKNEEYVNSSISKNQVNNGSEISNENSNFENIYSNDYNKKNIFHANKINIKETNQNNCSNKSNDDHLSRNIQAENLDSNGIINDQSNVNRKKFVSNGNLKETSKEIKNEQSKQLVNELNVNKINNASKAYEPINESLEYNENSDKINILNKEINYLRNIISDYKKNEIHNNQNIFNLEITKLNNLIKLKNSENELLSKENKDLKNHIALLQEKLSYFLNLNKLKEINYIKSENLSKDNSDNTQLISLANSSVNEFEKTEGHNQINKNLEEDSKKCKFHFLLI